MGDALFWHRFQFGFTITFHYLFPQLTMGLALLILLLKVLALRKTSEAYNECARFWARIFGINFVVGVVTGIPLEFQFGTNWARFSEFAGGVIGQTLAMEGVFAFFLESTFLGLFLAFPPTTWANIWITTSGRVRFVPHDDWSLPPVTANGTRRRPDGFLQLFQTAVE